MRYLILGFVALIVFSTPVRAQNLERPDPSERTAFSGMDRQYNETVEEIYKKADLIDEKLPTLRYTGTYTENFTPISQDLVDRMTELAFKAQSTENSEEQQEAVAEYRRFVKAHLTDMNVLTMALSLSKEDPKFGNPAFYSKIRKSLSSFLDLQFRMRDGKSPMMAFLVYNQAEEDYFRRKIGGRLVKSEVYDVKGTVYNVHDVEFVRDNEENEIVQYYFDISHSIRVLEARKIAREKEKQKTIQKL